MKYYEGTIHYEEDKFIVYFTIADSRSYILIVIGKSPEETYNELMETRNISHGSEIKIRGDIDYYCHNGEDFDAFFCQSFDLHE